MIVVVHNFFHSFNSCVYIFEFSYFSFSFLSQLKYWNIVRKESFDREKVKAMNINNVNNSANLNLLKILSLFIFFFSLVIAENYKYKVFSNNFF